MKINVFCGWGDGPDVGINIERTPEEAAAFHGELIPVDLTAAKAREMAAELIACAERAEQLDREYEEHCKEHYKATASE